MKDLEVQRVNNGDSGPSGFTVLVEENDLVRKLWREHYQKNEWQLEVFESPLSFLRQLDRFSGRTEKVYFYFDQDFGDIRGVGTQLARAVRELNPRQTVSLVTDYLPECFESELRSGLIQYAFTKYPEIIFGKDFLDASLKGRPELLDLMYRKSGQRCTLEKELAGDGARQAFSLEKHFPELKKFEQTPQPVALAPVLEPPQTTFLTRIRWALSNLFKKVEADPVAEELDRPVAPEKRDIRDIRDIHERYPCHLLRRNGLEHF